MRIWKSVGVVSIVWGLCSWGAHAGELVPADIAGQGGEASAHGLPGDTETVVFMTAERPILIRLHLQIRGKGFRAIHDARTARLFSVLDKNGDGVLNEEESDQIPTPDRIAPVPKIRQITLEEIDIAPPDKLISSAEFAGYVARVTGDPFAIVTKTPAGSQSIPIFDKLDQNADGQLDQNELRNGYQALRRWDVDNDEILNLVELRVLAEPESDFAGMRRGAVGGEIPFVSLPRHGSTSEAVALLLARYGQRPADDGPAGIPPAKLGLSAAVVETFDKDGNGLLTESELADTLSHLSADLAIIVKIPDPETRRPRMLVEVNRESSVFKFTRENDRSGKLSLGGVDVRLRVMVSTGNSFDNRQFYRLQFLRADGDKNRYLNEQEFPAVNLANSSFRMVDADQDGMIVVDELINYVDLEAQAAESFALMTVNREGQSIVDLIDGDGDQRLTLREFQRAFGRLRKLDRNADGQIAAAEAIVNYDATFEMGKPRIFNEQQMMQQQAMQSSVVVAEPSVGPVWFRKMDRNRDGDVSQREFLGPLPVFERLDKDVDGLISSSEAESAGSDAEKQTTEDQRELP